MSKTKLLDRENEKELDNLIEGDLSIAENHIDKQFGKGYAKEHPELISGYIIAKALYTCKICIVNSMKVEK